MGKSSSTPSFMGGSVKINGREYASAIKDKNDIIRSTYNMPEEDKTLYKNVRTNLNKAVKNLYNFSDATKQQWQQQLDAYKRSGIAQINSIYEPMQKELKNDIAGRFGNLDNSVFLDKLANITNNKALAVSSLADSLVVKQKELYNDELKNRMNYVSLLSTLNTAFDTKALNYLGAAQSNSENGNNYNLSASRSNNNGLLSMLTSTLTSFI